jgi:hypothetical protein
MIRRSLAIGQLRRNLGGTRVQVRKRWAAVAPDEGEGEPQADAAAAEPPVAPVPPQRTALGEVALSLCRAVDRIGPAHSEVVADAVRLFLTRYAASEKLPLARVLYGFVLRLAMQLDQWRAEEMADTRSPAAGLAPPSLGTLALELGAYPALAFNLMDGSSEEDGDPLAKAAELARWLDEALPAPESPRVEGLGCSRAAACCAVPFALGFSSVLPDDRLDFVVRAVLAGELKAVRYSLNFLARRGAKPGRADLSASDSSSSSEDDSDSDGDHEGSDDGTDAPREEPFRSLLRARPSPLVRMAPELTPREFHTILSRLPALDVLTLMQLLAYEDKPYAARRSKSGPQLVAAGKPFIPKPRGSVLRAYLREVHGDAVDDQEPDIACMADAVAV